MLDSAFIAEYNHQHPANLCQGCPSARNSLTNAVGVCGSNYIPEHVDRIIRNGYKVEACIISEAHIVLKSTEMNVF